MDLRRGPSAVELGVVPQYLTMRRGTAGTSHFLRDWRAAQLRRADWRQDFPDVTLVPEEGRLAGSPRAVQHEWLLAGADDVLVHPLQLLLSTVKHVAVVLACVKVLDKGKLLTHQEISKLPLQEI